MVAGILTIIHAVIWHTFVELACKPILRIWIFSYPGQSPEGYAFGIICSRGYLVEERIIIDRIGFNSYSQNTLPHLDHRFYFLVEVTNTRGVGQPDWRNLRNTCPTFVV